MNRIMKLVWYGLYVLVLFYAIDDVKWDWQQFVAGTSEHKVIHTRYLLCLLLQFAIITYVLWLINRLSSSTASLKKWQVITIRALWANSSNTYALIETVPDEIQTYVLPKKSGKEYKEGYHYRFDGKNLVPLQVGKTTK